jgi:hypothetical protein
MDAGGANANRIVDGCRVDRKSSKLASLDLTDLAQPVGYVLLDNDDSCGLTCVDISVGV